MSSIDFTREQWQAITTIDRSVLVTAAAGSGKTAVLAERCAYLICDAPPASRCSVDGSLVLTFTDAAAAEMRSRIHERGRRRLAERPHDGQLRRQIALIDTAHISTIHSFCLWMVRRWFHLLDVDAGAAVLDEDESVLLRSEALETLFAELYDEESSLGDRFRQLVEHYGLGADGEIANLVLRLYAFARSQAAPDDWLEKAVRRVGVEANTAIDGLRRELGREIARQGTECQRLLAHVPDQPADIAYRRQRIEQYVRHLAAWADALTVDGAFDDVLEQIRTYPFAEGRAPRKGDEPDPTEAARLEAIRARYAKVKEQLFEKRLRDRFALFSQRELRDDLRAIEPFVFTIVELVRGFGRRYADAKRVAGALDFSDLEHMAYRLMCRREGDVAAFLQGKFEQVLVDEFQDINPVQEAILRRLSREADPDRPDNLFAVGDVKQSIYRFRLAEPQLLLDRQARFDAPDTPGVCVRLQCNYRSRDTVLKAVNLLFAPLMRKETAGIEYDEGSQLRFGRTDLDPREDVPVEVHLLHRFPGDADPGTTEAPRMGGAEDPARWSEPEREAYLIGTRIRDLVRDRLDGEPSVDYGDIVILMRSVVHSAEAMVKMLTRMGIPAFADARGALFKTTEVRDVLSLLDVLDNQQQDIPLAAVLRSGVLGGRLNEDDLVAIRLIDRHVPFHEVVRRYAEDGQDESLRDRVAAALRMLARYRADMRQRPLADVLWRIYEETGFLAYVGGLTGGDQRRANLLRLHDRARQFGTFHRQGLHRFLRFIDGLQNENQDVGVASPLGAGQGAVRIMTVHRSKGLQFPVVFVAGLGRQFNLQDARGRMIYDREAGIGLRVVDRERMIEYPTAIHHLVAGGIEDATRAEELRLLYVATTRAEQRLILVASARPGAIAEARATGTMGFTPQAVRAASTALEWIVPVLAAHTPGEVAWPSDGPPAGGARPLFHVAEYESDVIRTWRTEGSGGLAEDAALVAAAELHPLPPGEPGGAAVEQARAIVDRLDYAYPHLAESSVRAVIAASELKRPLDALADPDDQPRERYAPAVLEVPSLTADEPVRGARRGTATHLLLQHARWNVMTDAADVGAEARRLVDAGVLSPADADALDREAIAWFLGTPLATRIRAAGPGFERERMFLSAEPAAFFDRTLGPCDVPVIVRGIVDGVLADGDMLELIDYKTDRIRAEDVPRRTERYAMQMRLYARAIERCRRRSVRACWLVFLHPRQLVVVSQD